ncbi:hypothetical protein [Kitasatospora griseola]|uniref:hypothetical protein n=1 Tax=Kitasatospora griseola TaxID=2064 RepID=UPI003442AA33
MPVPHATTALALVPLIVVAVWEWARRNRQGLDVYEPGPVLSPAEAADIADGLGSVYITSPADLADPAGPPAHSGGDLLAEADVAEARLRALHVIVDRQLAAVDALLRPPPGPSSTDSPPPTRPGQPPATAGASGRPTR